ncbi:HAD-IIIA family hydrolase [Roseateles terrae]|uniref:D,D-heptose 1,7-bisphosphate phosphatase n=1 Tax=Roseateles terrae TaxID=431060 RepID=A0ABR6GSY2_9BURK|nr:HAD-IIIA family hydrolase [Roseateles terrae]MBB3195174.1 histidinol-phosphate phosphatase family protein [Roseateles terrae]
MTQSFGPCTVAILAGGMGTRLKVRTGSLPKPMAPIHGRPVLQHQIELCRRHGFTRIALLVHYEHETIRAHFGDGSAFGVELHYCVEGEARGTAGALVDALDTMDRRFLVLYGDTYADVDLTALWRHHIGAEAAATLLLHPNDHPHDSDLVEVDDEGRVLAVHAYPHPEGAAYRNLVNAALYVMERSLLPDVIPLDRKSDLAKHTFPAMLDKGLRLLAHITPEYIKDMGTPERLDKVERDITVGLPERLSGRQPRTAVFLDRDGTLNVEVHHLSRPNQLQLIPGAGDAVRMLNRAGVLAVGVTNQPVVARGDVTLAELARIHATLDHQLGASKAYLDRMYVCPHHPDRGFPGEVPALKIDCDCRKPRTGMIDRAIRELGIGRGQSWMVGDTTGDLLAGQRAGLRTVLVRTGHAGLDGKYPIDADYVMPDLSAAVHWILEGHPALSHQLLPVSAAAATARLVLIAGPARAGKSSAARVLAEQLRDARTAVHVLSLDGWLRPAAQRAEGGGVLQRYDLDAFKATLMPVLASSARHVIQVPSYARKSREVLPGRPVSIGPQDLLIVEGVPALMDDALNALADVRVFLDLPDDERRARLTADYVWRGENDTDLQHRLDSRERDELPAVRASANEATHHLSSTTRLS